MPSARSMSRSPSALARIAEAFGAPFRTQPQSGLRSVVAVDGRERIEPRADRLRRGGLRRGVSDGNHAGL